MTMRAWSAPPPPSPGRRRRRAHGDVLAGAEAIQDRVRVRRDVGKQARLVAVAAGQVGHARLVPVGETLADPLRERLTPSRIGPGPAGRPGPRPAAITASAGSARRAFAAAASSPVTPRPFMKVGADHLGVVQRARRGCGRTPTRDRRRSKRPRAVGEIIRIVDRDGAGGLAEHGDLAADRRRTRRCCPGPTSAPRSGPAKP